MKNKENNSPCIWTLDDYSYDTSCDDSFKFYEDGIKENNFKFCPYCGGHIVEVKDEN